MGMKHEDGAKKHGGFTNVVKLVSLALVVTAVVKELKRPAEERTWNGVVAGFVPYDLRMPTLERFKERIWNPDSEQIIGPRVFGVGWDVNVGRVVALVRQKTSER